MKEPVTLSKREVQRMQVLEQVKKGAVTLKAAAAMRKVSDRQAKRLWARYRREGPGGLTHQRRGQPARNGLGPEIRERVLVLHRDAGGAGGSTDWPGDGPPLAA